MSIARVCRIYKQFDTANKVNPILEDIGPIMGDIIHLIMVVMVMVVILMIILQLSTFKKMMMHK